METVERAPTIRTAEVEQAAKALLKSIQAAAQNPELERDAAEGQLSSLMGSLWNSAERATRKLPLKRRQSLE